jgi:hypothetical protein
MKFISNRLAVAVVTGAIALASVAAPASAQQPRDIAQKQQDKAQRKALKQQQRQQQTRVVVQQPSRVVVQERQTRDADQQVVERRQRVQQQDVQRQPRVVQERQPVQSQPRVVTTVPRNGDTNVIVRQPQTQTTRRLSDQRQKELIIQQQRRLSDYDARLRQRQIIADQRAKILRQQNRINQYRFQQEYLERLRQQQLAIQQARYYNYNNDPYFYSAPAYRYYNAGRYYEVNQYAADLLRQAVNYGYQEGFRAGQADRSDRWNFGYQNSYAYEDANFGYTGFYVDQSQYNYYFREGFRRGYEDGYYGRYHYGVYQNGTAAILGSVLNLILNFTDLD